MQEPARYYHSYPGLWSSPSRHRALKCGLTCLLSNDISARGQGTDIKVGTLPRTSSSNSDVAMKSNKTLASTSSSTESWCAIDWAKADGVGAWISNCQSSGKWVKSDDFICTLTIDRGIWVVPRLSFRLPAICSDLSHVGEIDFDGHDSCSPSTRTSSEPKDHMPCMFYPACSVPISWTEISIIS